MFNCTMLLRRIQALNGAIVSDRVGWTRMFAIAPERDPVLDLMHRVNLVPIFDGLTTGRYFSEVRGEIIEEIFASWVYARRGPLALALKLSKGTTGDMEAAARAIEGCSWMHAVDRIQAWVDAVGNVSLVPVPGNGSITSRLATRLREHLKRGNRVRVENVIRRTSSNEMKNLPWALREKHAQNCFEIASSPPENAVIIDDVMTSGATARRCAHLLQGEGTQRVAAAVVAIAPEDAPWKHRERAPLPIMRVGDGTDHDATVSHWFAKEPDVGWLDRFRSLGLPPSRLLDLGTGSAGYAVQLTTLGHRVVGLDINPRALDLARSRAPHIPLVLGSAHRLPFRSGCFGIILLRYVIHHFSRDEFLHAVKEAAGAIAQGGFLVIETSLPEDVENHFDNVVFPPLLQRVQRQYHNRDVIAETIRAAGLALHSEAVSIRKEGEFTTVEAALTNSARLIKEGRGPKAWISLNERARIEFHDARSKLLADMFPDNRVPRRWQGRFILAKRET